MGRQNTPPGPYILAALAAGLVLAGSATGPHAMTLAQRLEGDPSAEECTIAVLAGTATADGRPLLWKNRDTGRPGNEAVYFRDGRYPYLTLVTAGETNTAWLGVNSTGFAVCNALSYNLGDSSQTGITNGALMKLALQRCSTVASFESLLVATASLGRQNPANLGVIDALGGAALFEVGSHSFARFDATDTTVAPDGFVARANFSLSADTVGIDTWRFRRARAMIEPGARNGSGNPELLLRVARDLTSASVDPYPLPYAGAPPEDPGAIGRVNTEETINRRYTVSAGVVRGVRIGEDARLTTFYAVVGHPEVTAAIPLWVAAGNAPPEVDGPVSAPICDLALDRVAACFDTPRHRALLNTRPLVEGEQASFLLRVEAIEGWLLPETERRVERWRRATPTDLDMRLAELELSRRVYEEYGRGASGSAPAGPSLVLNPNPTRGQTLISYDIVGGRAGAGVEILDLAGRRVALVLGDRSQGLDAPGQPRARGYALWDGRDLRGRPVSSGIYFLKAQGSGGGTGRLVVVR